MGKVTVPMGPAPPHSSAQGPRTFVPLQDILVGLEVLLLLHVHVGGGGQVPRHAGIRRTGRARGPATRVEASATPGWRISAATGPGRRPQGELRGAAGGGSGRATSGPCAPGHGAAEERAAPPGCAALLRHLRAAPQTPAREEERQRRAAAPPSGPPTARRRSQRGFYLGPTTGAGKQSPGSRPC